MLSGLSNGLGRGKEEAGKRGRGREVYVLWRRAMWGGRENEKKVVGR